MQPTQFQFDFESSTTEPQLPVPKAIKKEKKRFLLDVIDMIAAPIMTYTTQWTDCIPQELKEAVRQARMVATLKKEETATIPEVLAYMITRTFEAPMHREWVNIYTWCGAQYAKQYREKEFPDNIAPEKLDDYEQMLLKRLRQWIYEKRRQHIKNKL